MKSLRDVATAPAFLNRLATAKANYAHISGEARIHPLFRESPDLCPTCNGDGVVYNMNLPENQRWAVAEPGDPTKVQESSRCDCTAEHRKLELFAAANVPRAFEGCTLDTFPWDMNQSPIFDAVHNWDGENPLGILLWGDVGRGKTGIAVGLLRESTKRLHRGKFVTVVDLLTELRDSSRPGAGLSYSAILEAVKTAPFLVLDDIGKERVTNTGYTEEAIFQVVDYRMRELLPTVYTSNMDLKQLTTHLGEPTMSRIIGSSLVLQVAGRNHRNEPRPRPASPVFREKRGAA